MIDLHDTLKIWRLTSQGQSIPLSHTKVLRELEYLIPDHSGQELLNFLRMENLVSADIRGNYLLTEKGICLRKQMPDSGEITRLQRTGHEWDRFRKLLGYYMDCVQCQEKSQHYLFENDLNRKYFIPILPFGWLKELGSASEFSIIVPKESRLVQRLLLTRSDDDEDVYIGYPITAFRTAASQGTCYSPIGLIPIDITDSSETTMTLKLRLDEAEINQQWLEYSLPREDKNVFINAILSLHKNDNFRGMIDLFLALPFISQKEPDYLNPNHLDTVLPKLNFRQKQTLCNVPVLFVGQSLLYSKTLKRELKYIHDLPDETLDSTALAYVFREPALQYITGELKSIPLPFISSNIEQMAAIKSALNTPVTKITGPPGTGKSQVAVNIIANQIFSGKSVLFTSKNHKAVMAIASRSQSLLEKYGLSLVTFCTNEDRTKDNSWYKQDLDMLTCQISGLENSIDSDSISHIDDASSRWRDLEEHFSGRNIVLNHYAKLQKESDQLIKKMQLFFPNESEGYSADDVKILKKHISNLCDEPQIGAFTFFPWLFWKCYRKKMNEKAYAYIRKNYPVALQKALSNKELKKRFHNFYEVFSDYQKIRKQLIPLEKQTKNLPRISQGNIYLSDCLNEIKTYLLPAFVCKRCKKIQELIDQPEIVDKLKSIMSVLRGAQSPFFFQRVESNVFREAKEGFELFASYFPGWATTLLSLTKASPCIPHLFDTVIIDEASQCDIPPVIPALFRAKSVVFIGDPNQFPPVRSLQELRNDYLKAKHDIVELSDQRYDYLRQSAYDLAKGIPVLLKEHFRCTEDIAAYCNKEFYSGQLCIRSDEHTMKFPSCMGYKRAVEWINVKNSMVQEFDAVKQTLETLVRNNYSGTIGVITPFREYADQLKQKLYYITNSRSDIMINTANAFQGGERDVMLFVLCYNDQLTKGQKWYAEAPENRYIYNVAVSRAKACLIIIGDKEKCQESGISVLQNLSLLPYPTKKIGSKIFDSPWEKKLFDALWAAGIEAKPQYPVMGRRLDLAVISGNRKIDVEIDGVHWHTAADGSRKLDDIFRDLQVGGAGWIVQRFWVYELQDDMDGCVKKIKALVQEENSDLQKSGR